MPRTNGQRFAVFTVHRGRCWICHEAVASGEMEVDHIIPERLDGTTELQEILKDFGLPPNFTLNSYENWMPAHRSCNGRKGGTVFRVTPLIQGELQRAANGAARARELEEKYWSEAEVDRALTKVLAAHESNRLTESQKQAIAAVVKKFAKENLTEEERETAFKLAPWLTVIGRGSHHVVLKGPTGMIGGRPIGPNVDRSFDCPTCGPTGWNGARCISCGHFIDLD